LWSFKERIKKEEKINADPAPRAILTSSREKSITSIKYI
jgi:hypothetical protein